MPASCTTFHQPCAAAPQAREVARTPVYHSRAAAHILVFALLTLGELTMDVRAGVRFTCSWQDNSDNERGFRIERSIDGSTYQTLGTVAANVTTYADDTAEPGRAYWYRVAAYNAGGDSVELPIIKGVAPTASPGMNSPPTLSALSGQTLVQGTLAQPVAFTIADAETPVDGLELVANSSNPTLVPVAGLRFRGAGASRTLTIAPAPGQTGWSTIWIKVSDGSLSTVGSFVLVVTESKPPTPNSLTLR